MRGRVKNHGVEVNFKVRVGLVGEGFSHAAHARALACCKTGPSADAAPLSVPTDRLPLVEIKVNLT